MPPFLVNKVPDGIQCQEHNTTYGSNMLQVTILASEWESSNGGLSAMNRELAIQLAKLCCVKVTLFMPTGKCSAEHKKAAHSHGISILEAVRRPGLDELQWLIFPPDDLQIDVVVGHGVQLGHQAQFIRKSHKCKWVQFVHTDPEELGIFKCDENSVSTGEQMHNTEVELCHMADLVVGVGPKLAEVFRKYLHFCNKSVFEFTPGVFDDFASVQQVPDERRFYSILLFGLGDVKDFDLKGFDIAARAISVLPDTHLLFVGAPHGKQEEIAKRLFDFGIPKNRLRVRGYLELESLKRVFCEVDLVLMPSRTEGFGFSGLAALSAGLPVIASKNSGFGEALSRTKFGSSCVIDSEDPSVWTSAIKGILKKDRESRLDEVKAMRGSYVQRYSWSEQCGDLLEKMFNIVNGPSPELESTGQAVQRLCLKQKKVILAKVPLKVK
ncbi:D-inositol 3-phosphate glycosyltransferase 1-like [Acropora millepora]|uniref:D-inositol 3-phosphate glycosyltransferase 1-like n=1 Tax=Acropora millepora TaxID=45264 RepID=UPI001CF30302|nr:D-inositol 3-phosphate glycosyltransferase 1-like [Acropora millepora]